MVARYGFQRGAQGGGSCASTGLIADLIGGAGVAWGVTADEAISELHEKAFENYNRWCAMVRHCGVHHCALRW